MKGAEKMAFFSRNIGLILKTFLYQIVMSIFGFMIYGATYKNTILLIVGQVTVALFFFYIMVTQMFEKGSKNCEYDRCHGESSSMAAGFLFALIAFLPTIILSVISLIAPPFAADGNILNGGGYVAYLMNKSFLQGMYSGIHQILVPPVQGTDVLNGQCLWFLVGAIPGWLICGVSYLIGYRQFKKN